MKRQTHFEQVPMKPHRVYEEMNQVFGRDTVYVTTIGLSQIAGAQFLHVYKPAPLDQLRPGRPARLDHAGRARRGGRRSGRENVVALSGDYDFQFLIEELAVGAQHAALRARRS
jgi:tartronate-semialdehyde synthase